MNLAENQLQKIDDSLRDALERSDGHEVLRTVMVLEAESCSLSPPDVNPQDFPTRQAYREALIETQRSRLSGLDQVRDKLQHHSLRVRGGTISQAAVVEGKARDILASLALPEVRHATLDQPFGLNHSNR